MLIKLIVLMITFSERNMKAHFALICCSEINTETELV